MSTVVFVGNCQALALSGAYSMWIAPQRGETVHHIPAYEDADETAWERVRQADVVVLQVTDTEQKVSLTDLQTRGRVVMFPMVTGFFLWPFVGGAHPRDATIPSPLRKIFTGEFGDRWLDKRIAQGEDPQALCERYRDSNVVREGSLDRLMELVMLKQQERDARADMHLGDYIMAHLGSERLFLHVHHPDLGLFAQIVREVFPRIGCTSAEIEQALSHYRASPFPPEEHPIHPRIAEHLGLRWAHHDLRYRLPFGERATWDVFCQRYVAHDWNEPLQHCLARCHRDLPRNELETLASELEAASARYDSSEGYFGLCDTRWRLGDLRGSLEAVRRAVSVEPFALNFATRHAELLSANGYLDEGLAAAEDVVAWQPQYAQARILLFEIYDQLGRTRDALREARAALTLAPDHPHVVRRLAEFENALAGSR
jgi:tetratricopeptide (TPR) repeat protein